jgi:hypothetical protein
MYPWRRDEVDTDDLASVEVAEEVEREDSEENVRSGEEYDEMAGVAGTEGEGEEARTAAGKASVSIDRRGSSIGILLWVRVQVGMLDRGRGVVPGNVRDFDMWRIVCDQVNASEVERAIQAN